jgi:hypothetical protein
MGPVTREYTADETGPFVMAPCPPATPPALSPDQQSRHDALVAALKKGIDVSGSATQGDGAPFPVQVQLTWDDEKGRATGSMFFPTLNGRKITEGRIIDDATGPILQIVETGPGDPTPPGNVLVGMVYTLRIEDNAPDRLIIQKAQYGDPLTDRWADVTDQVKALVSDHSLQMDCSKIRGPDPAYGVFKTLQIDCATLEGKPQSFSIIQGKKLTIDNVRGDVSVGWFGGKWSYRANTMSPFGRQFYGGTLTFDPNGAKPSQ